MSDVIKSRSTCEVAMQEFNLEKYGNLEVDNKKRPAGCYWRSGNRGYYNIVVDPLPTDPKSFGDRGGLCRTIGKNECIVNF